MKQFDLKLSNLHEVIASLKQLVRPNERYVLTIKPWSKRTISANAIAHVWIKQISEHTGENIKTVEARCKRDHGLSIALGGENGVMLSWMLGKCNYDRLSDSQQLKIISAMEITRNFTTKEHNDYRDSIQQFWNDNGLPLQYMN